MRPLLRPGCSLAGNTTVPGVQSEGTQEAPSHALGCSTTVKFQGVTSAPGSILGLPDARSRGGTKC